MIKGTERLLDSLGHDGWEMDEVTGFVELYNHDRTRRLVYHVWGDGSSNSIATMELHFLNENRGWNDTFRLKISQINDREWVAISAMARGRSGSGFVWDPTFEYSENGRRRGLYGGFEGTDDRRVLEDRAEMLLNEDEMPAEIDMDLTASLFVDQFARGEMTRPVLVPKGAIVLSNSTVPELISLVHGRNLDRATRLLAKARTTEEVRVATAIYKWVEGQRPYVEVGI